MMGKPPALPGRQQKIDIFGSPSRTLPRCEPPSKQQRRDPDRRGRAPKPLQMGEQIPCGRYPQVPSQDLKWILKTGQSFKLAPNQQGQVKMGEAKRKTYPASFKAKVGLEAIRGVKTANEIGQEHGVHPAQVGQWKKAILEQAGTLFETKRGRQQADEQAEPDRFYSEIGRLKMALDGLKKSPD